MALDYDIGIIGGGPAGSSAAIYLAKNGFSVCLFEKRNFPRETLCGEFLSNEVIENLKELNLFNEFLLLNPNKINSFRFFNGRKSISSKFSFDAFAIKRSTFDNFLLEQARKIGIKIFQPAEIKNIKKEKEFFVLNFRNNNSDKSICVKNVIAAYGKQNILDKRLNRNFINYKSRLNGIKFHIDKNYFKNLNESEIQIYAGDGIYCGVNCVNENKVTVCFLENRKNYNMPIRKRLTDFYDSNKNFKNIFRIDLKSIIKELPVYGTGNIFFGKRDLIENGIFMVGDAAGVIAPLAGDGIGMAFETSKIISKIFSLDKNQKNNHNLQINYISEWNEMFIKRLKTAKFIQNIILNRSLTAVGFNAVYFFPNLLDLLIEKTRS